MPKQELFFEQQFGERRVEVLKSYDQSYAHDAFENMSQDAHQHLHKALKLDEVYELADLPDLDNNDGEDFLWEELLEQAREDGSELSFFIVNEVVNNHSESVYVSPDWPSAEAFARIYQAAEH